MNYEKLSASQLAKRANVQVKEVYQFLVEKEFVAKNGDAWGLTDAGKAAGGEEKTSNRFGTYLVWPKAIRNRKVKKDSGVNPVLLSSTKLGGKYALAPNRINRIFNELGWIDKGVKGWKVTEQGERLGGIQKQHPQSGVPYVLWPEYVCEHKALIDRITEDKGEAEPSAVDEAGNTEVKEEAALGFRERFPATHRTADGHMVRSRAEMLIDNWLYMSEIVHAYERKLPVEEDVYCDFYIPTGKVYVEFWGMENSPAYLERKNQKLAIYEKYGFKLIQLRDDDITNLDDILPRELLKFDIQTF